MFRSFHYSFWLIIIQTSCLTFASPLKNTDSGLDAVLVLPLHSRAPTPGEYLDLPAIANHMRAKHGFPTVTIDTRNSEDSSSLQRRVNSNNVALFDDGPDLSYFATIKVGTPHPLTNADAKSITQAKKFNVVLDTGSSDLFLSSSLCTKGCEESVIYDPSESRTSQVPGQAVNLKFGSVAVSGEVATDIVTLGGFSVNPQTFVMAKAIRGELLGQHVHGLMGLGFQSLAKTGAVPFVESLVNGKRFKQPLMSFYFQRHLTDSDGDAVPGGTLTLGDVNPQFFTGDIERHLVNTTNFWNIRLETITSQGVPIPVPSSLAPAIIDTGATLIAAPSSIFTIICQRMGGTPQTSGRLLGFCVIPCDLDPTHLEMAFTFVGGKPWSLNSADLIYLQPNGQNDHACVSPVFDLLPGTGSTAPGVPHSWIIGLAFLKNVYTVFDFNPPSVGFAALLSQESLPPPPPPKKKTNKRPPGFSSTGTASTGTGAISGTSSGSGTTSAASKLPCKKGKFFKIFSC